MFPMTTTPLHHYTFKAQTVESRLGRTVTVGREVGVNATSPAEGEQRVRATIADVVALELVRIGKAGDGCGDDRCSVCNPSSRNGGRL
jgi:hypothetical protein